LDNGRAKNDATSRRYKNFARALKNAENALVKAGRIDEVPSYLMECLTYVVQNPTLRTGDLSAGFKATLFEIWDGLQTEGVYSKWIEPNGLKWLFGSSQKWTPDQAKDLVLETWRLLEYS
jgi:hypothetical protein